MTNATLVMPVSRTQRRDAARLLQQRRLARTVVVSVVLTAVLINVLHPVYVDYGANGAPWNLARYIPSLPWMIFGLLAGALNWIIAVKTRCARVEVIARSLLAASAFANVLSRCVSGGVSNPIHLVTVADWRVQCSVGDICWLVGFAISLAPIPASLLRRVPLSHWS